MDRRAFLGALAVLPASRAAAAQQAGKVYRIGLLSPTPSAVLLEPFVAEMRGRGWTEGQHFVLERPITAQTWIPRRCSRATW